MQYPEVRYLVQCSWPLNIPSLNIVQISRYQETQTHTRVHLLITNLNWISYILFFHSWQTFQVTICVSIYKNWWIFKCSRDPSTKRHLTITGSCRTLSTNVCIPLFVAVHEARVDVVWSLWEQWNFGIKMAGAPCKIWGASSCQFKKSLKVNRAKIWMRLSQLSNMGLTGY